MTPGDFLRAVWPSDGVYCLAFPFRKGGWFHKTARTIEQIEALVAEYARKQHDVYFCVHTLKQESVWNPAKVDPKTGERGCNETRTQTNTAAAKAFFFDLDVGSDPKKYASQKDALTGLLQFVRDTGLPKPMVVSSGRGLHVYWRLSDAITNVDEWRDTATRLRQLANHYGLRVDPKRTTDNASVLRVAGTFNFKNRAAPLAVTVLKEGHETATGVFRKLVSDAVVVTGAIPRSAPPLYQKVVANDELGSNLDRPYEGPRPAMKAVLKACPQMARLALINRAKQPYDEPEWYAATIGVGRFTDNPNRDIHKLSSGHPNYTEAATNAKIAQSEARQSGPTSCAAIAANSAVGDSLCVDCVFAANPRVRNPIQAAVFEDPAPAPTVEHDMGDNGGIISLPIPDPPEPYIRLKSGGVAVKVTTKDNDEQHVTIMDYDLYPLRRVRNTLQGIEQHAWYADMPNTPEKEKEFTLDADALYDTKKFTGAISNKGLYPSKGNISHLQDYMVAYISKLQRETEADTQCNHLGWSDDFSRFILPDKIIASDGTAKPASLSIGAMRSAAAVGKKGDLATQIELLKFYSHPDYVAHQIIILAGLAAPVFHETGHHGVIVNASGDAGASKSTSLYTAASFWGQPELYAINGTNNGATVRGRNERVTVLANLPICVDEITHMPVRDAVDLAMSITQPGHRIRLDTSGVERAAIDSYKATIMLTTANNSLHSTLSIDNSAGTAGSMRVFEVVLKATSCHKKWEADAYLRALKENFGWIGEAFITYVIQHRREVQELIHEQVQRIDRLCGIRGAERFWSSTAGTILAVNLIASKLGLLHFNHQLLENYLIGHQIPWMRGIVREEYSDPLAVLGNYLATISANTITTEKQDVPGGQAMVSVPLKPTGSLLAHYDLSAGMLYVLKQGFKDYCVRIGANYLKIIDALATGSDQAPVIPMPSIKRTLGVGTPWAKGQAWCFAISMSHRDVTGLVDLDLIQGGRSGEPKAALRVAE